MMRFRWLLTASLACATGLFASDVSAAPADEPWGPWDRGTVMPRLGFGASFSSTIHQLSFGLGATYFVWDGLGIGLEVWDTVYLYRGSFKSEFPGIDKTSPTNEVLLLPTLRYVFLRQFRFSPYVVGGLGPVFYNHQRGTVGQWLVGTGAYIKVWGPVAFVVGIDFMANFPDSKWKNAFVYDPPRPDPTPTNPMPLDPPPGAYRGCALVNNPCSFNISPNIGLVVLIGPQSERAKTKKRQSPPPAPVNPMPEAQPVEPEPAEPEPEPEPVETSPPVDETAPPEDAPPEDTTAPPPEDAPPIEPPPDEGPPPPPEDGVPPT